jgi:hypothetical protein
MTIKMRHHSSRDATHLLKDHAVDVLTLFGIVVTFGIASAIGCVIWLLVW